MVKLYNHVSRFLVRSKINRGKEKLIKWALTLKIGDIINDCSGFNVYIENICKETIHTKHGWYINDISFNSHPDGDSCSLIYCGVEPEVSREQVEINWLNYAEQYLTKEQMIKWYGNNTEIFNKKLSIYSKRISTLKSGGHITDELGVLLPEFR